jgi:hypothetical protein
VCAGIYFLFQGRRKTGRAEAQTRQFIRKYKEIIVEVKEWPQLKSGQSVLTLESLEYLIKVAQGLLKPVHHAAENGAHLYWVNDDSTRYEFHSGEVPSAPKKSPDR